jgi:hypothetical protein
MGETYRLKSKEVMTQLLLPAPPPHQLEQKQNKKKSELIEQLKKTPIIQIACDKVGIGRATFYRWRKDDKEFAEQIEQSLNDGAYLVSDMAESKLISAIKKENLSAIIFWLKSHHPKYRTKLDVNANFRNLDEPLTPEQESLVREALRLAGSGLETIINQQKHGKTIRDSTLGTELKLPDDSSGISGSDDRRPESENSDNS